MSNEGTVSLTPKQIIRLLIIGVLFLVFLVDVCLQIRAQREATPPSGASPFGTTASGAPTSGQQATDARNAALMETLFGPPRIRSHDPSALMKAAGQPTRLSRGEAEWLVTPSNPTTTTAACATGPVVTIDLHVETTAGTDSLPLDALLLITDEGPIAPSVACSTGFTGTTVQRLLAFPATSYDQLMVADDPTQPQAIWHLP
ncbi:hypothetical protein Q0Z83_013460 [Actinoplanes sichuanensis]|uniref:Secreted protein n=1 Tax=Actinoplanes sichuanensis TaxID=512349 RepID=A0ABW4A506_9ACTN|nr:hypothetical protein [Actinoplanes sichuanensis]BEL03155.1 hypothetical protein Q0Z83_013460 [Actinoplanes sichuanensis]